MLAADIPAELRSLTATEVALIRWLPECGAFRQVATPAMEALIRALWVRFPGAGLVAMSFERDRRAAHLGPRGRALRRALDAGHGRRAAVGS